MLLQPFAQNITLRPAIADDVAWAAPLFFAAGPAVFSYVFASPFEESKAIFCQAFAYPQHAFSYEHAQIVEVLGQPAGVMISYPGSLKRQADEKVHAVMARILPLRKLPKILVNLADLTRIKQDIAAQDYYILGLSVMPELRNQGLGTYLLRQAEQQAQKHHCQSMALDVTYTNTAARALFERLDYKVTCSKSTQRFDQLTRSGGLHRLVKVLTSQSPTMGQADG
ncbi:MAG: GNAT family N-acetyltransferase [Stenomitos frigidus ULC029]